MSIYGDLSKPQREILLSLLQRSAVSIETAHTPGSRRAEPYVRLRSLGLVEFGYGRRYFTAWLTPAGLQLVQAVRANAATSRYRRFRDASLITNDH